MIQDLQGYPTMRPTSISWLPEIPAHWDAAPLCALARPKSVTNKEHRELLSVYLHLGVVRFSDVEEKRTNATSKDLSKYQAVDPGDFVLNNQQAWRGSVGVSAHKGIVSPAYLVLSLNSRLRPDFANLLFRERTMVSQYLVCSKGVGSIQRNLYWPHLKRVTAVLPPLEEQAAIVRFLGYANGRIQRYIQAKKKLIKLLEEQKRVIIHRAVTQGVNPGARLKPSGVEWLGDVPEHWEVRRLKTLFREVNKRSETGTETLLSLRMYQGLVPHEDVSDKPIPPSALVGYKHVVPGQLVMNRMRAAIGIFGVPTQAGLVSPDYAVFVPASTVVPSYYLSLFKTEAMCSEFRLASKGLGTGSSGFMRLYTDQFGRLWVPLPPLDEQEEILRAIEVESSEIESALSVARREVELLREYRSRLIADVVTGQLDVREAASNLPDSLIHPEEMDIDAEDSGDEFDEDEGVEN